MTEEEKKHLSETAWSLLFEIHYQNCHISKQIEKFNTFTSLFGLSESEIKEMKKVLDDLVWTRKDFFKHDLADKLITGLKTDPLGIMTMFNALTPDKKFEDWLLAYLETVKGMIQ
jgi:hypothetical protein